MNKKQSEFKQQPWPWLAARGVALVAGVLTAVLSVLLITDYLRIQRLDPLNHPQLLELQEQWAASDGTDQELLAQLRTMDLFARRAFFVDQAQRRQAAWLLLGSAVVLFLSLKLAGRFLPARPEPPTDDLPDHLALFGLLRQLFAGLGLFLVVLSLFFTFTTHSDLEDLLAMQAKAPPGELPEYGSPREALFHSMEDLAGQWPGFRGPLGQGIASAATPPVAWNVDTGEGILWKTEVPLGGFNSPVVWDKRIFLTGADADTLEVYCFDADTGALLWRTSPEDIPGSPAEWPEVTEDTGYAAPTMATDGYRVFAFFATGDLACWDFEGRQLWGRNLGVPNNPYGVGSSLITDGRRLFVQYDHENEPRVMALDNATGEELWRNSEREEFSWATPLLANSSFGDLLIVNGAKLVDAYDPASGKRVWSVDCLGGEVAPSPAFYGDRVFVANEYAMGTMIQLQQDAAEPVWEFDEYLPEISSPLLTENHAYIFTTSAEGVCLEAATGKILWEAEFEEIFSSSPIQAGSSIYVADQAGYMYVLEMTAEYNEKARIPMGEPVYATPAFVGSRIYMRTAKHLYGMGAP